MAAGDFWDLNLSEIVEIIDKHQEKRNKHAEYESRERWEIARWQTYFMLMPHLKKNTIRKPSDLQKFPWDKDAEVLHLPKEKVFTAEDNQWFERMKMIAPKV